MLRSGDIIWRSRRCISWGNTIGRCTHPLVSIAPHGPIAVLGLNTGIDFLRTNDLQ